MGEAFLNATAGTIALGQPGLFQNTDYWNIFNAYVGEEMFVDLARFRLQEIQQFYGYI
jgi:hypothetical protein